MHKQHKRDARNGTAERTEGRKAGTLSGVRGHSNFTRGLTLRRVECAPPPSSSSSSFLSFLPRPRFHHHPPFAPRKALLREFRDPPCAAANERPRELRQPPPPPPILRQYRTRECMTTSTWPMKSGTLSTGGDRSGCDIRAVIVLNLLRAVLFTLPLTPAGCVVHRSRNLT